MSETEITGIDRFCGEDFFVSWLVVELGKNIETVLKSSILALSVAQVGYTIFRNGL